MDKTKKFDLKSILMLVLVMMLSVSMLVLTACGDTTSSGSSSPSSSSAPEKETVKDYQQISNGDFEFGSDEKENDDYPVNTGIYWSRANDSLSTSAVTSSYASGVINTDDDAYNAIASKQKFPVESGSGDSAVYFNPRTPYYYGLVKDSYVFDKDTANKDGLPTTGNKVLMIHNKDDSNDGRGTAQKFTSTTTMTIDADTYQKVSVWVLTKDLKTVQNTTEFGAYVSLSNTLGSAKNPLIVKNINTNGEWAQVNLYLEGSSFTSVSYRLVLGLGFGSRNQKSDYCEGFAYFDNVTFEKLTKEEYETATSAINSADKFAIYTKNISGEYEDTAKNDLVTSVSGTTYEDNGAKADAYQPTKTYTALNYALSYNVESTSQTALLQDNKTNAEFYPNAGADFGASTQIGEGAFSSIASSVSGVTNPLGDSANTLYMILANPSSHTVNTKNFTLADGESMMLSFYLKVKAENSQDGVTLSIVDKGTTTSPCNDETSFAPAFNTTAYTNDDTNDWAKCFVFITNDIGDGKARNFNLKIDFGPTQITTDYFKFASGYALFTGFETTALTKAQYDIHSTKSEYTGELELGAELLNGPDDETPKDTYDLNYSKADNFAIETGLASTIIDHTGVVANHTMVGGNKTAYTQTETISGLFNTEYVNNYDILTADEKTTLNALEKTNENKYVQGLLIKNSTATSYGYLGPAHTISPNQTATIAVKLRVFGNAKAFVYLANANPLEGFDVLGISAKKWTFDKDKGVEYSTETAIDKKYVQTVTASECEDGWKTVYFKVTAGINEINYRLEVWNGARDGSELSEGMIVVEGGYTNATIDLNKISADNGVEPSTIEYRQAPTLVNYYDEDGKAKTRYDEYNSKVVYTSYDNAKTIIASHASIDVEAEITEEKPSEDDSDNSSSEDDSTANARSGEFWLQIASVVIVIAMVIALLAVIFRKLAKATATKHEEIKEYYSRDTRDQANRRIAENKRRKALLAKQQAELDQQAEQQAQESADVETVAEEEVKEYDYDNMDNNVEPETVAEEVTETETLEATDSVETTTDGATTEETPAEIATDTTTDDEKKD